MLGKQLIQSVIVGHRVEREPLPVGIIGILAPPPNSPGNSSPTFGGFDLEFSARHLVNPIRTLANWNRVETVHGFSIPVMLSLTGLFAYATLIHLGMDQPVPIDSHGSAAAAGEPGSANILY